MMDGLWTAEFGSSTGGFSGGVVVLRDGKLMGGDAGYYYLGDYQIREKSFQATIQVFPLRNMRVSLRRSGRISS
jgi:hypothetical protein